MCKVCVCDGWTRLGTPVVALLYALPNDPEEERPPADGAELPTVW